MKLIEAINQSHLEKIHSLKTPQEYLQSLMGKINYVLMINNEDREFQKYKQELRKINHFK